MKRLLICLLLLIFALPLRAHAENKKKEYEFIGVDSFIIDFDFIDKSISRWGVKLSAANHSSVCTAVTIFISSD